MSTMSTNGTNDDLSALAWVAGEVRRSLDAAQKSLRRYLKETEGSDLADLSGVDPSVLRQVRAHIHQSVGALELVGLGLAAQPLRAAEAAVLRMSGRPGLLTAQAVQTIENGFFALLDFLSRTLAGKSISPLSMFPQYQALQELAGAPRAHPADLWPNEWQWRAVAGVASATPLAADEANSVGFETQMLALMRGRPGAAARLGELCDGLAASAEGNLKSLWRLAAAFLEGLDEGALKFDVHAKRVASRLLAQLRTGAGGQASDRLAQDLLFFCAQARPTPGRPAGPRLSEVRQTYQLEAEAPVDYDAASLGLFDPALLSQARKRVATAKDAWSAVSAGDTARLAGLGEPFALVGDSLERLYPGGGVLAQALRTAVAQCQSNASEPSVELAMEVATSLLYIEASLEDAEFDHPQMAQRVERLAQRIDQVGQGREPDALELWMEELYRRVSDRQTIGNVVQELRASLSEVEKQIDQYFRDPAQRAVLIPVPAQLSAMRGVLSLLDMDHASQAVLRMRDDVDALANTEVDPERAIQAGTFDRLADNLGALSFLIDMVSVQPQMARSLFHFNPDTGQLVAAMTRAARRSGFDALDSRPTELATQIEPTLVEQAQTIALAAAHPQADARALERDLEQLTQQARAADQVRLAQVTSRAQSALAQASEASEVEQVRRDLADSIQSYVATSVLPLPEPSAPVRPVPPAGPPAAPGTTGLEDDAEMREIFLEEAREVTATARAGLADLRDRPDDLAAMTVVRRAFHTLKGSSRMVGLADFGEAAWACEQLFNARLADSAGADADLRGFSHEVLDHFDRWTDAIEAGDVSGFHPQPVIRSADALRLERRWLPLAEATATPATEIVAPAWPSLQERVADLPSAADLDLAPRDEPVPADGPRSPDVDAPAAGVETADLSFDFQLDLPQQAEAPAAELVEVPLPSDTAPDIAVELSFAAADADAGSMLVEPAPEPEPDFELDLGLPAVADGPAQAAAEAIPVAEIQLDLDSGELLPLPDTVETFDRVQQDEAASIDSPVVPAAEVVEAAETTSSTAPAVDADIVLDTAMPQDEDDEQVKVIGDLRVGIPLFNIYLNEADELSRRLSTELAEWAHELHRPAGETPVALAHSLAGSSATVGFARLSQLARSLEHALMRSNTRLHGRAHDAQVFGHAAEEIRRLLHQFAAGFLREPDEQLMASLAELEHAPAEPWVDAADLGAVRASDLDAMPAPGALEEPFNEVVDHAAVAPQLAEVEPLPDTLDAPEPHTLDEVQEPAQRFVAARDTGLAFDEDIDAVDAVDDELFQIFVDEAAELLPQLHARLRDWAGQPAESAPASACMRTLHTLKGSARLAGAMRLGEMAHRLESAVERLGASGQVEAADVHRLMAHADTIEAQLDALRLADAARQAKPAPAPAAVIESMEPAPPAVFAVDEPLPLTAAPERPGDDGEVAAPGGESTASTSAWRGSMPAPVATRPIDWSRFVVETVQTHEAEAPAGAAPTLSTAAVRVRAPLLDRLVNHAGEVSITRVRIESDVDQMKGALRDLDENLDRLRHQLRDIELQGEMQIGTRLEAARAAAQDFDPLEMDRFTRFQEITRMMAESVNDVATVQRGLQRTLQSTEDELARQARLTRDLQDDLLRTRMVEFDSLSERLYRVLRQAAKETGKQVRLDLTGGTIEVDRGVLDRITGAFEHVLRNSVVHGIEMPAERLAAGKDAAGTVTIAVTQEGNEVAIDFRDDGAGLDLRRIREKAVATGLLEPQAEVSDADLAAMIFHSGFSTAEQVTGLAGRGVGMDVVRTDVNAMGGRIETATAAGQGTSVRLVLPLTTAVTQVVMMRCGDLTVAVPSTLVEIVRRVPAAELPALYEVGRYRHGEADVPFFWLASLLQGTPFGTATGRTVPVVVIRSAAQRVAVHVDEVLGNQEVVVKNLGAQLSRLPGLAGMTLLPSGAPALIYNPVALAALYGQAARSATLAGLASARQTAQRTVEEPVAPLAPLVLVVDDSLTVRRVTQRLLVREGYRVAVAKDGLEGLERLADELPVVVLTDIEMPRMDGFDLVRNMRVDARLSSLPVIMITSRIAQKHRDYAVELGVDHYLGKPYVDEDLLALVARYAGRMATTA